MQGAREPMMTTSTIDKRDKWIPWYFVAFFVGLAIMDGIFVYLAKSTFTGVVTDQAYERGLKYNETVAAAEAQAELGWVSSAVLEGDGTFNFTLSDGSDVMAGAEVTAEFTRPTQSGVDFELPLVGLQNGTYSVKVDFPLEGVWDVRVYVTWNQQQYQHSQRLIVR